MRPEEISRGMAETEIGKDNMLNPGASVGGISL